MTALAIIASTLMETNLLLERMTGREETTIQGKSFFSGRLCGTDSVVCICGIGKANAAQGATLLIERFRPECVVSIGVAGAYPSSGLLVGDIAVAEREIYGDEGLLLRNSFRGMETLRLPLARVKGKDLYNEFPLAVPASLKEFSRRGAFITVSSCTGSLQRGREMEEMFQGLCENMEGAAVAQVCTLSEVPCTEIRGISNIIEDRDASPLNRADIITASENVQRFILGLVEGHHILPPDHGSHAG